MKTKLTLSIDKELVQFARQEANKSGKSISGIFSDFLLSRKAQAKHQSNPQVNAMLGSLKSYKIDDSKVGIQNSYAKKYSS